MAELQRMPVLTFTIGFEDNEGFDERPYARLVAERFGTEHVEFVVNPDAVELVERLVWHHDQPFGDSSAVPTFMLSELTKKHVTVSLCGDGGDELFAGYERFTAALVLERYGALLRPARAPLARAISALPFDRLRGRAASLRRFLERSQLGLPDAFLAWVSFIPAEWRQSLLGEVENWATDDYRRLWRRSEQSDLLDRLLDLNLRTYLVDDLLPKVDRMGMAHALEVRSPFLDHELVELALRLPRRARVHGWSRKRALKAAVRDLLPREILHRRKRGFGIPLDRWFRSDLRSYLQGTLAAPDARVRSHLSSPALDALLAEHQAGEANHGHPLWTLLTLEIFLRQQDW
jgi:asparagine synthase (glutamine-hydrolysing)